MPHPDNANNSQDFPHNDKSLIAMFFSRLPENTIEQIAERAAILMVDGGLPRYRAIGFLLIQFKSLSKQEQP